MPSFGHGGGPQAPGDDGLVLDRAGLAGRWISSSSGVPSQHVVIVRHGVFPCG